MLQLTLAAVVTQAQPLFKCQTGTAVTYQQTPCSPSAPRKVITAEQLNAERRTRESAMGAAGVQGARVTVPPVAVAAPAAVMPGLSPAVSRYRCDGRRRCPQMTSCEEAKFFLANCPGVEMDGDHDGIPCERQWCQ
jgi:hypothetical protein